jgi:hemoglobin
MKGSFRFAAAIALTGLFALSATAFAQDATVPTEEEIPDAVPPTDADIPDATPPADAEISDAIPDATPPADAEIPDAVAPASDAPPARNPAAMDPAPADPRLLPVFKDFGEMPGLIALMDDFMVLLLADARTKPFFENADQKGVKRHLAEQFCVILGGPCTYTGRDMKTVHEGFGITRGNFNALVEDLQIAMTKRGIPFRSQNKLLAKLAPLHRDIEEK